MISGVARIPEDMVFRDVTDRFKEIEGRLSHAASSASATPSTPWPAAWC